MNSKVVALLSVVLACASPLPAQETPCSFDGASVSFSGSEVEQAKCLLRPVQPFARLGRTLEALPSPLDRIVGEAAVVDKVSLRRFLRERGIDEAQIGGSLDEPVSRGNNNDPNARLADYFVIHDTSTPNFLNDPFPANIDKADWPFNNFSKYGEVAHVFVNRVGMSATKVNLRTPFRATKFETRVIGIRSKGRFLHVEMIQPRKREPRGGARNDALAPDPGFTEAQLERLALIYIAASSRRGRWLTPAFHAVVDAGLADAHDDPQRFDLELWARRLGSLLSSISGPGSGTAAPAALAPVAPAESIEIGTVQSPVRFRRLGGAGIDEKIEVSAVAALGNDLLIADDKKRDLVVFDLSGQEKSRLSANVFPERPKWEALARDDRENFYVIGSHQSEANSTLWRFRVRSGAGSLTVEDVVRLDVNNALSTLGLRREDVKVEGLAVRVLGEGERLRRELVIGLRRPSDLIRAFAADITSLPDQPENGSPIELGLTPLFTFKAGEQGGVPLELSSLEHVPAWNGFLIVTSTEDERNAFHGNVLWFLPDAEASGGRPAAPRKLWLFGLSPSEGRTSRMGKAEGLVVLEADSAQEGHGLASLALVYDNDAEVTGIPSLLQRLTLVHWRD